MIGDDVVVLLYMLISSHPKGKYAVDKMKLYMPVFGGPDKATLYAYDRNLELETCAGGDPRIVAEFLRYVAEGGQTKTSPVAARYSVAAGCAATQSLRQGSTAVEVEALDSGLRQYFEEG